MEKREDLKSILPYLPLLVRASTLFWPSKVVEALKSIARGPEHSRVNSGEVLSVAISDIRRSISFFEPLAPFALNGYALFFDDLISRAESTKWFGVVLPALANFLLQLPSLLESHYQNADDFLKRCGNKTGLRILGQQEAGIVFLSQVLPLDHHPLFISYPDADAWSKSFTPLCPFEAHSLGSIEDHSTDSLQVDFANKYIGGGALCRGCAQEEIRFMINPELIAGMLFLPSMGENEAIEIVGAERFSEYNGYASSFRFSGDHMDKRNVDVFGRRKTRIIAIDASCWPGAKQYALKYLLRINLAHLRYFFQTGDFMRPRIKTTYQLHEASSTAIETNEGTSVNLVLRNSDQKSSQFQNRKDYVGIVTGNWGCGAFGGDSELKAIIQWLAASQALRPFMSYYTFGLAALQNLGQVTEWILSYEWTVGDLWNMMVEYSSHRLKGETNLGFFTWLLPSLTSH